LAGRRCSMEQLGTWPSLGFLRTLNGQYLCALWEGSSRVRVGWGWGKLRLG
jgi:hypothetical protein